MCLKCWEGSGKLAVLSDVKLLHDVVVSIRMRRLGRAGRPRQYAVHTYDDLKLQMVQSALENED